SQAVANLALDAEVPALIAGHFEIWVNDNGRVVGAVRDLGRRRKRSRIRISGYGWRRCRPIKREVPPECLEGRIGFRIAEDVIEDAVVEDAVPTTYRGLSITGDIVREANTRLKHQPAIVVKLTTGAGANSHKCEISGRRHRARRILVNI